MALALLQFAVTAVVIIIAGSALARFADAIADLTGLGRLLVGSILLAGATSLPELMVDIHAVRMNYVDMAVGDLVGSSLFNLLILAILDLSHRSRGHMLSRTSASHALSGTASILLTGIAAFFLVASRQLPSLVLGGLGAGTLVLLVAYAFVARLVFYDQRVSALASPAEQDVLVPAGKLKLSQAIIGFSISALAIILAGPFMAEAAGKLAELTGLGGTFVGSTLVAFCTSLPELVASAAAVRMGAFELAVGNIYGSNAFNMILLAPLDLFCPGSIMATASLTHVATLLATIVITAVALMGQLYHVEKRRHFLEPDAVLIIVLVFAALGMVYLLP